MRRLSVLVLPLAALFTSAICRAQANPATPQHPIDTRPEGQGTTCSYGASRSDGKTTGTSTCPAADPANVNASRRFPYPGEASQPLQSAEPPSASPAGAQAAPAQSAGKRFPYPGENTPPQASGPLKDAGSSGESTSSSSSSSEGLPEDGSASPEALPAPKRGRKPLPPVPRQTPDEREQEDVKIAAFYQNDGNYRAAYMRAKDAVGLADDDPEAQFALAEAARKLGKLDEAQKSYKRCMDLDPVPKLRKASEKALKEMAGS